MKREMPDRRGSRLDSMTAACRFRALLVVAALLLPEQTALAVEESCRVRMVPESAQKEWQRAGLELSQCISSWRKPDRDCRDLLVEVSKSGALVTITTRDGRQAKRAVATPQDLTPVASALAVSVIETPPSAAPDRPGSPHDVSSTDSGASPPPSAALSHEAVLGALGGVRIGSPGGFVSPLVRASAGLEVN